MFELKLKAFRLRFVEEEDAAFIIQLRTNKKLAKHLSVTSPDIEAQKKWIRTYKKREEAKKEFYFLSETYDAEKLGLNRIYNITENSFELGSWIFKRGINEMFPILSDLAVRDFAFDTLKLRNCLFEVRKENKSVVRYHQLYKPEIINEDEMNYYFRLDYDTYQLNKQKIKKIVSYG